MSEIEQTKKLLILARRDLRAAEILGSHSEVDDAIVGFHAQQASEKALKAWLTFLGVAYPRTHDLSLLLHLLEGGGAEMARFWDLLDLNSFAVQFRYELLEDEPLDHEDVLDLVAGLIEYVEELIGPTSPN